MRRHQKRFLEVYIPKSQTVGVMLRTPYSAFPQNNLFLVTSHLPPQILSALEIHARCFIWEVSTLLPMLREIQRQLYDFESYKHKAYSSRLTLKIVSKSFFQFKCIFLLSFFFFFRSRIWIPQSTTLIFPIKQKSLFLRAFKRLWPILPHVLQFGGLRSLEEAGNLMSLNRLYKTALRPSILSSHIRSLLVLQS